MTNLDRLKGTPYLIDGLESFLKSWLSLSKPSDAPYPWNEDQMARYDLLPPGARQFYDLVRRWPEARMLCERSWDQFAYPPYRPGRSREGSRVVELEKDPARLMLLQNYRRTWRVEIGVKEENYGILFNIPRQDRRGQPEVEPQQMAVGPEEFLVTFAMRELLLANPRSEWSWDDLKRATSIYTGRYRADRELEFLYCPDNGGCLWMREQGSVIMCTYQPD